MKILNLITSHNQLRYLPYVFEHQKKLGCDLFVIDLGSTDGSLQWCQRRTIPHLQIEPALLEEFKREYLGNVNPEWVMETTAAEMVILRGAPLQNIVRFAAGKGVTTLRCRQFDFFPTGEEVEGAHPRESFFYYEEKPHRLMIRRGSYERHSSLIEGFIYSYQDEVRSKTSLSDVRHLETLFGSSIMHRDKDDKGQKNQAS